MRRACDRTRSAPSGPLLGGPLTRGEQLAWQQATNDLLEQYVADAASSSEWDDPTTREAAVSQAMTKARAEAAKQAELPSRSGCGACPAAAAAQSGLRGGGSWIPKGIAGNPTEAWVWLAPDWSTSVPDGADKSKRRRERRGS